ncbi:MAG TPA: acylneuraminate cytidylyltransferase family protein [Burkholderiales bacterium]|nr:acylneuraminate cytidylyltransferase family protein [Burkholderiales bacterium]
MNVLGLIPARGGSKSIPRKNIRDLCGKPLIAHTIAAARSATSLARVVVSTDDDEIAAVAQAWGADVPFMRPAELALDDTPGVEPVLHALAQLPEFDWVLLLQPTSPLRTAADIDGIVARCRKRDASSAVSVCEAAKHPYWMYERDAEDRLVPVVDRPLVTRRQSLPPVYALNGALYLAQRDWLQQQRALIARDTLAYVMPPERSVDIDSALDWRWVECLMQDASTFSGCRKDRPVTS